MKTTASLIALLFLACVIGSCASVESRLQVPEGSGQPQAAAEPQTELTEYTPGADYVPLSLDLLSAIHDQPSDTDITVWAFTLSMREPTDRSRSMVATLLYDKGAAPPRMIGGADRQLTDRSESFHHDFSSPDPFLEIVDFMTSHPEVFFDHSEFEDVSEGPFRLPEGVDEYFIFGTHTGYDEVADRNIYSCIVKGIGPGVDAAPEIVYVMDRLRLLRDDILLHPVEPGQGQQ